MFACFLEWVETTGWKSILFHSARCHQFQTSKGAIRRQTTTHGVYYIIALKRDPPRFSRPSLWPSEDTPPDSSEGCSYYHGYNGHNTSKYSALACFWCLSQICNGHYSGKSMPRSLTRKHFSPFSGSTVDARVWAQFFIARRAAFFSPAHLILLSRSLRRRRLCMEEARHQVSYSQGCLHSLGHNFCTSHARKMKFFWAESLDILDSDYIIFGTLIF